MCLCTVYWSHRVHLSKNQKHDLSLSSKLAKTEEKKVVVFCCALKAEVFPLSSLPWGLKHALWRELGRLDLWYEGHHRIISTHLALGSDLSNVSAESRTHQVWYQVLNLWGLSLFQSHQTQLNNHYCLLCASVHDICIYSTLDLN